MSRLREIKGGPVADASSALLDSLLRSQTRFACTVITHPVTGVNMGAVLAVLDPCLVDIVIGASEAVADRAERDDKECPTGLEN